MLLRCLSIVIHQICTSVSGKNKNKLDLQPTQGKDLCCDLLSVQYAELTHPARNILACKHLRYRFVLIYLSLI